MRCLITGSTWGLPCETCAPAGKLSAGAEAFALAGQNHHAHIKLALQEQKGGLDIT